MIYFLRQKSDTLEATEKFLADAAPYGKVKRLRSDNGGEFISQGFRTLLRKHAIRHETSAPYSLHQNGRNRCFNSRLEKTPYEALTGQQNLSKMHVFGSPCYVYVQNPKKLEARSKKGIFVGYDKNSPSYLVYYPETRLVERACCVKFVDHFQTEQTENDVGPLFPNEISSETIAKRSEISEIPNIADEKQDNEPLVIDTEADTKQLHDNTNIPKEQSLPEIYPTRTRNKPSFYGQDKTDDNLSYTIDYCYKLANIPADYQQAIESPEANKWKETMDAEMNALIDNDTFELVPCPKDRQIVGAKWVYTIKTDQNEKESYKARFVAKGYSQIPDIDYQETFAPTARMSTIRTLLQHAMQNDLIVHQMDVKTAYLNAPIDREIYIEQPEGFRKSGNSGETLVCKLKRSLYGLKQSGRNWNNLLHDYLTKNSPNLLRTHVFM